MTLQDTTNEGPLLVPLEEEEGRLIVVDSAAADLLDSVSDHGLGLDMSDRSLLSPDDDDEEDFAASDAKQPQSEQSTSSTAKHSSSATTTKQQLQPQAQEEEEVRTYSHADLQALNLLDQPIWIFDIVKRAMWFANTAAVELWSAPDLPTLLERDFSSDMSEATANRLDDYLLKFSSKDATLRDRWTFYPNNGKYGPKTVDCTFKGVMIEEGRLAMLSQGVFIDDELRTDAEQEALRAVEMLRHLPVAVCLTDVQGNVMEQNPEALAVFGSLDNSTTESKDNKQQQKQPQDDDDSDSEDEDYESGGSSSASTESTFVKRFVDKDLGRRILKEATKTGDDNGKNVIRLEALQHTVHGPRWSAIQVRQTKDPVTSKPILLYSARDITAVIEAKRQATAADLAKMDLLADMAHAIRTPLHHVVGVVELISRQGHNKKDCQSNKNNHRAAAEESKYSNLLQSAAQLLMNVIHDLMGNVGGASGTNFNLGNSDLKNNSSMPFESSKPTNRIQLEHSQINVKQVVENAIATVTPSLDAKNLVLAVQMTRNSTDALMGDGKRLGQILFEILHNAVKYTSTGGITVKVRRHTKKSRSRRVHLRFEVADTGVGLNLEQQSNCLKLPEERSTSRQEQEDNKSNSFDDGVGLVLCKSLVEAMGGKMGVESKPGRGATFWFEIPFLRAATGGSSVTKKLPPRQSKRCKKSDRSDGSNGSLGTLSLDPVPDEGGLQILLVDHDNAGRNVMAALLEQSGHSVTAADNGDDMVTAVSQGCYDVVLVETQLPNNKDNNSGTALDAARAIRTMGYSIERLPMLALTAAVPRGDYPELGLNDWLTKPILLKDIKTAMTNAICNVGARSVGGASSVCTGGSSICTNEWGTKNGSIAPRQRNSAPSVHSVFSDQKHADGSLPQRHSAPSVHSVFSDQLQAIMGSSSNHNPKAKQSLATKPTLLSASSSTRSIPSVPKQKSDHPPNKTTRRSSLVGPCA